MLIDIHVHSDHSACSVMPLEDILANGLRLGLDGVCITDHDTSRVLAQIEEGFQPDGLLVLVGMEYTTPQGDFLIFGDVHDLPGGMDLAGLTAAVLPDGGAVVAAHPFRGWRPSDASVIERHPCSAIEVVNGRNTDTENRLAARLADRLGMPAVAGSDAHSLDELGRFPTRFTTPIRNMRDLTRALNQGECEPATTIPPLPSAARSIFSSG